MPNIEHDPRATALLIEHLGFAPIKVVDEVINAVNQIMVQGIEALENYLTNVHAQGQLPENVTPEEILSGTAKLESLIQYKIDFAFDKYELYCLSNIFHIPTNLIDDGWFRLKTHEGIDFTQIQSNPLAKLEYDDEILRMNDLIRQELYKRQYYKLQIVTFDKIKQYLEIVLSKFVKLYDLNVLETATDRSGLTAREILAKLGPVDQTLENVVLQLKDVIRQVELAKQKLSSIDLKNVRFDHNDEYIEKRKARILKNLNLNIESGEESDKQQSEMNGRSDDDDSGVGSDIEMFENITDWDIVYQEVSAAKESRQTEEKLDVEEPVQLSVTDLPLDNE